MCPSLLESPRESRDVGTRPCRGIWYRQGRNELPVSFEPTALLRFADPPENEICDWTIQDTEQIHLIR